VLFGTLRRLLRRTTRYSLPGSKETPPPRADSFPWLEMRANEFRRLASAVATRAQPPKPASLRNAGFAAPCGGAGMWLLLCPRVAL